MEHQPNVLNFSLGSQREPTDPNSSGEGAASSAGEGAIVTSIDLLRDVPLRVTVELGRARLFVRDVLAFRNGSVIELDRPAGGAVDLLVNGVLIARGEVVIVDERFGVRISEVVRPVPNVGANAS